MARRSNKFTPTALPSIGKSLYGEDPLSANRIGRITQRDAVRLQQIINAQIRETNRLASIAIAESLTQQQEWLLKVIQELDKANIQTQTDFKRLLSATAAEVTYYSAKALDRAFRETNSALSTQALYATAIEQIARGRGSGFKLYIDDAGVIEAANNLSGRLLWIGQQSQQYAQDLIYAALTDSFIEAWNGLTPSQFPLEYRSLILELIGEAATGTSPASGFYATNPAKIRGRSISEWSVFVDFEALFGGFSELEEGYHYGALDEAGDRVNLPFTGQRLTNENTVRYGYWFAMWSGKRTYRPYGATNKAGLIKKNSEALPRLRKRLSRQTGEFNKFARNRMEANEHTKSTSRFFQDDEKEASRQANEMYDNIERTKSSISNAERSEGQGIPIPAGQRQKTIDARVAYWRSIGKAPFWYFLEFGQLKYSPKIPPRGVFARFYLKARNAITEFARIMYNDMFQNQEGYFIDTSGTRRLAKGAGSEYPIPFYNVSPRTKPGGFLPAQLKRAEYNAYGVATRTAREAEAAAGQFGATRYSGYIEKMRAGVQNADSRIEGQLPQTILHATPLENRPFTGSTISSYKEHPVIPKVDRRLKSFRDNKAKILKTLQAHDEKLGG